MEVVAMLVLCCANRARHAAVLLLVLAAAAYAACCAATTVPALVYVLVQILLWRVLPLILVSAHPWLYMLLSG